MWRNILCIFIIIFAIYIYNYRQISNLTINKVTLNSDKIHGEIRITQISDFHSNRLVDLDRLYRAIEDFDPNFIVLTGDIIDRNTKDLDIAFNLLQGLSKLGKDIFSVYGNHEVNHPLLYTWTHEMNRLGIVILDNKNIDLSINHDKINISGFSFVMDRKKYIHALNNMAYDKLNILLSHSPDRALKNLCGMEDIVISGHTHGGQIRLPFIGAIIAPGQGLFPKYDRGIIEVEDTILYIDSGLGNSKLPIRAFNPIQISNITIKSMHP